MHHIFSENDYENDFLKYQNIDAFYCIALFFSFLQNVEDDKKISLYAIVM